MSDSALSCSKLSWRSLASKHVESSGQAHGCANLGENLLVAKSWKLPQLGFLVSPLSNCCCCALGAASMTFSIATTALLREAGEPFFLLVNLNPGKKAGRWDNEDNQK